MNRSWWLGRDSQDLCEGRSTYTPPPQGGERCARKESLPGFSEATGRGGGEANVAKAGRSGHFRLLLLSWIEEGLTL